MRERSRKFLIRKKRCVKAPPVLLPESTGTTEFAGFKITIKTGHNLRFIAFVAEILTGRNHVFRFPLIFFLIRNPVNHKTPPFVLIYQPGKLT